MMKHEEAAEQLRLIRTMMQRATIFRALSGEAALIGGAAALAAGWITENKHGWAWGNVWLAGLILVLVFATVQLIRTAQAHQKTVWSHGLRVALRGALPSIIAGGFLGLLYLKYGTQDKELFAASFWILHYGLALLAIQEFAPRSMFWLGVAFSLTGLAGFCALSFIQSAGLIVHHLGASGMMALTFGGYHLIYGTLLVSTNRPMDMEA
jgi:hypothetical protein